MAKIALVVAFGAAEGRKDDLIAALKGHAQRTMDNEDGCIRFDVLIPRSGDADIMLYELYRDQAALDEHASSDRLAAFREETKDLVGTRHITITEVQN